MNPILSLDNISKKYTGIQALKGLSLDIYKGEVHSIIGENGAGKSTLIKIITGAVLPTAGSLAIRGEVVDRLTPRESYERGISVVYQELNLIPELNIYENIFLGREIRNKIGMDRAKMKSLSMDLMRSIGIYMDPTTRLKELGVGSRQIVEIAKALSQDPEVMLLDEPTASLTQEEVDRLHGIILKLKEKGIAVIYISHKLDDVFEISDKISVLRDGEHIRTVSLSEQSYSQDDAIRDMIGRNIEKRDVDSHSQELDGEPILELRNVTTKNVKGINLKLYRGEILSISGLLGSKRTDVLNAIFGVDKIEQGQVFIGGRLVNIKKPRDAIGLGIGYLTEDRKDTGLFMDLPIKENTSIVFLKNFTKGWSIDKRRESLRVREKLKLLKVKYTRMSQKAKSLSGGNQQKVAIGKWIIEDLDIIMMDEPTRGVDIGAKDEIYKIMNQLARSGKALLIVSSEAEEVINISDRTIVMSQGRAVSQYSREDITSEKILKDSAKFLKLKGVENEY